MSHPAERADGARDGGGGGKRRADADAAGDESDGFDEFDDGSDFPVMTAHSEPEPVDPLLSPDAETAGSDSPRL